MLLASMGEPFQGAVRLCKTTRTHIELLFLRPLTETGAASRENLVEPLAQWAAQCCLSGAASPHSTSFIVLARKRQKTR